MSSLLSVPAVNIVYHGWRCGTCGARLHVGAKVVGVGAWHGHACEGGGGAAWCGGLLWLVLGEIFGEGVVVAAVEVGCPGFGVAGLESGVKLFEVVACAEFRGEALGVFFGVACLVVGVDFGEGASELVNALSLALVCGGEGVFGGGEGFEAGAGGLDFFARGLEFLGVVIESGGGCFDVLAVGFSRSGHEGSAAVVQLVEGVFDAVEFLS